MEAIAAHLFFFEKVAKENRGQIPERFRPLYTVLLIRLCQIGEPLPLSASGCQICLTKPC